jgi:hypothetical protein
MGKKKKKKKEKNVEVEEQEKKTGGRKGGNHPKHPKCPECGRALYKTLEKGGSSRKDDPFAFCRREECKLYGIDQSGNESNAGNDNDEDLGAMLGEYNVDDCFVTMEKAFIDAMYDDRFL